MVEADMPISGAGIGAAAGANALGGLGGILFGGQAAGRVNHATGQAYKQFQDAWDTYGNQTEKTQQELQGQAATAGKQYADTMNQTLTGGPNMPGALNAAMAQRQAAMSQAAAPAWQAPQAVVGAPPMSGAQRTWANANQQLHQQRATNAMAPAAFQGAMQGAQNQEQAFRLGQQQKLDTSSMWLQRRQQAANLQQSFAYEPYARAQANLQQNLGKAQHAGDEQAMYGSLVNTAGQIGGTAALLAL